MVNCEMKLAIGDELQTLFHPIVSATNQAWEISMGNKVVRLHASRHTLSVDDTEFKLTPGLVVLITQKHPRPTQYNSNDYKTYKSLVAQTNVKLFLNMTATARPNAM